MKHLKINIKYMRIKWNSLSCSKVMDIFIGRQTIGLVRYHFIVCMGSIVQLYQHQLEELDLRLQVLIYNQH